MFISRVTLFTTHLYIYKLVLLNFNNYLASDGTRSTESLTMFFTSYFVPNKLDFFFYEPNPIYY